jgi:predicted metal-binding transcription factor (methanogenesis marker protein 9)
MACPLDRSGRLKAAPLCCPTIRSRPVQPAFSTPDMRPRKTPKKKFQRNFSDLTVWSDENKEKKLYIVLIRSVDLVTFGHQY